VLAFGCTQYDSWFTQQAYLIRGASDGIEAESAKEKGGKPVKKARRTVKQACVPFVVRAARLISRTAA
jgi:hypothetical protein